jgi:hypothetical protein
MRLSHDPLRISASFDDPDLVSRGGLVPVMALAGNAPLLKRNGRSRGTSSPRAAHGNPRIEVVMILGAVAGIVWQQRDPSLRAAFSRLRRNR